MNQRDILKYGHLHIEEAVKDLIEDGWVRVGATTKWSVKDIIAHLASFEIVCVEVLKSLLDPNAKTPNLEEFKKGKEYFNDSEVAKRAQQTHGEIWAEYEGAHADLMFWIEKIPPELFTQVGTLPWYGAEYCLDDLLVYMNYGHKQEHKGHIEQFRKREDLYALKLN